MYKIVNQKIKRSSIASISEDKVSISLNSNDFLFSQASIVSSVILEKNSYKIKPISSGFVNSNGDAWSNESLRANYGSFIGAFNFINHDQVAERSVGFVADAVLRRINLNPQNDFVYFVDILIATSRGHEAVSKKIISNQIKFLSMGCESEVSQCSRCGEEYRDFDDFCDCLSFQKGKVYFDETGQRRKVAELLGNGEKGSVDFMDASYLTEVPAFGGAIKRNILLIPKDTAVDVVIPRYAAEKPAIEMYVGKSD